MFIFRPRSTFKCCIKDMQKIVSLFQELISNPNQRTGLASSCRMNAIRLCKIEATLLLIVCEACVRTLFCLENKNVISILSFFMHLNSIFLSWLVWRLTSELMAQKCQDIITFYKTYCTYADHKPKMCYFAFLMTQQTTRAI